MTEGPPPMTSLELLPPTEVIERLRKGASDLCCPECCYANTMIAAADLIEALTRAPSTVGVEADETGWLIERGDVKPEMILYFRFEIVVDKGITIKHWSWTSDNLTATRFARKVDAELAWQCATQRDISDVDIVKHMWCGPTLASEKEGGKNVTDEMIRAGRAAHHKHGCGAVREIFTAMLMARDQH
jgi:hypothetical protein